MVIITAIWRPGSYCEHNAGVGNIVRSLQKNSPYSKALYCVSLYNLLCMFLSGCRDGGGGDHWRGFGCAHWIPAALLYLCRQTPVSPAARWSLSTQYATASSPAASPTRILSVHVLGVLNVRVKKPCLVLPGASFISFPWIMRDFSTIANDNDIQCCIV